MNKIILVGRLAQDPESRKVGKGKDARTVCNFTIAVDREGAGSADFIRVAIWGASAEACAKYLAKGRQVAVEGELHIDRVDDEYYTTVSARRVQFLSGTRSEEE